MRKEIMIMALIAAIVIVAAVLGSNYYRNSVKTERKPPATANSALVRDDSATLGPADAPITLVEFYDPECETCAVFGPIVKKIVKDYDGKIRLVVRYMPLHPSSVPAANFIEAAGEQGKFWQAQELLFQKQSEWGAGHGASGSEPAPDINALFEGYARELGLDAEKVSGAIKENRFKAKIERDRKDGQALGVNQTPSFFVNGRKPATFGEEPLRQLIEEELKK